MNQSVTTHFAIAITAGIVLSVWFWPNSTPIVESTDSKIQQQASPNPDADSSEKDVLAQNNRRQRKGPRKPPKTFSFKVKSPQSKKVNSEAQLKQADIDRKRDAYFEQLDNLESPSVNETILLGEMAFEANEAESAYEHYLEVIDNHSDHFTAPYALYKLAWAEFNFGDVAAAISDMQLMLEWIEDSDSIADKRLREMGTADLAHFMKKTD